MQMGNQVIMYDKFNVTDIEKLRQSGKELAMLIIPTKLNQIKRDYLNRIGTKFVENVTTDDLKMAMNTLLERSKVLDD